MQWATPWTLKRAERQVNLQSNRHDSDVTVSYGLGPGIQVEPPQPLKAITAGDDPRSIHVHSPTTIRQKDDITLKSYWGGGEEFDWDRTDDLDVMTIEHNDFQQGSSSNDEQQKSLSTMEVDLMMRFLSRTTMTLNFCWKKH